MTDWIITTYDLNKDGYLTYSEYRGSIRALLHPLEWRVAEFEEDDEDEDDEDYDY